MSIGAIFSIILTSVTYVYVLFLRYFALKFIYNDPAVMWSGSFVTIAVTAVLLVLVNVIGFYMGKPFDQILKQLDQEKRRATEDEARRCLKCYKKLNILTLAANFVGFFVGQIVIVALGIASGKNAFIPSRVFFIIAQAIGFGGISAISTIKFFDYVLIGRREKLQIPSLLEYKKECTMNISTSISLIFGLTIYFIGINHLTVPYGILYEVSQNAFHGDLISTLLKKGVLCFILSGALCIVPFTAVIVGLSRRIKGTSKKLFDIANEGDLSSQIMISMTDDFGLLTSSINTLIQKLSSMINELRSETVTVDSSAQLISDSTQTASNALLQMSDLLSEISKNTQNQSSLIYQADENITTLTDSVANIKSHVDQQADTMENISASINQMASSITSVTEIAKQAQTVSVELSQHSEIGNESVRNAVNAMKEIQAVSEEVQKLSKIIQDVSSQTNLLAMNAAIEAAHAGEFGKGFAVVADEVRSLAASSSNGAKDVQNKIKEMLEKIDLGVQAITSAGSAFNKISEDISVNANLVKNISDAMVEQNAGANQTLQNSVEIVNSVQAIRELTKNETENANQVRTFMKTVVEATKNTEKAISESSAATSNLQTTIKEVNESAAGNKSVVQNITKHVSSFKTIQ